MTTMKVAPGEEIEIGDPVYSDNNGKARKLRQGRRVLTKLGTPFVHRNCGGVMMAAEDGKIYCSRCGG